jgi:hypothetical protein
MFQWCCPIHSLLYASNQCCVKFQDTSNMEGTKKKSIASWKGCQSKLEFSFYFVLLLFSSQIQLECFLPFQIEVFQYTILRHYLSRPCCQNVFSSCGTYVFSPRTIGVAWTLIFWMMEGKLMQFHPCKHDIRSFL